MFPSTMIWIILAVIYGNFFLIGAYRDRKYNRIRQEQQEARRCQQNREWHEQFNQLSPSIHAAIRMMREDQRERAYIMALFSHYKYFRKSRKDKVDWKKEGF